MPHPEGFNPCLCPWPHVPAAAGHSAERSILRQGGVGGCVGASLAAWSRVLGTSGSSGFCAVDKKMTRTEMEGQDRKR